MGFILAVPYLILASLALDLWDRFVERYGIDVDYGEVLPARWLVWGRITGHPRHEWRYLLVKLPSYVWAYNPVRCDFGMGQRALVKVTGRPWRVHYIFN